MEGRTPPAEAGPSATSAGWKWRLAAVIAAGTAVRLAIALTTHGQPYDMNSVSIVRHALADHGFDAYSYINIGNIHWPYPPGYFPWIRVSGLLSGDHAHVFEVLVRLPMIVADAALAWLVQDYLRLRGAGERVRLAAAAVVALGPAFGIVSSYQGQMDSLAILPAVGALVLWERMGGERRALVAGALLGVGGALKTVPLLMVLALAPTGRSWRELAGLAGSAAAVPILVLLPFLIATPGVPQDTILDYQGFPGQGGLSLAAQPDLTLTYLMGAESRPADYSGLTLFLVKHASAISYALYAVLALFFLRYRPAPAVAASLLWLATFALAPAFFFQYLIWGLPFFLMAGYVRATACLQLVVLVPMLLFYGGPWEQETPAYFYVPIMLAAWIGMLGALAALARGTIRGRGPSDLLWPVGAARYEAPATSR